MAASREPARRTPEPTEHDRFSDLARRLISVPKKEVDREAKKYERRRQRRG